MSAHRVVPLGSVVHVEMGQAPAGSTYNSDGVGLPLVAGASDLGDVSPKAGRYTSIPTKVAVAGDLILCIRATIGDRNVADRDYCLGRGVAGLRAGPSVDPRYLWHAVGRLTPTLVAEGRGSTFLQVGRDAISSLPLPLPPLPEQRRIAAILDEADALRRKRREALGLLDELLRSAFLEMFGDPVTNPRGWETVAMREVIADSQYGTAEKANTDGVGLPVLRMNNLGYDGSWDLSDLKHCAITDADREKFTVQPGDLLFNRTNSPELVGKTGVWKLDEPFAFAGYLIRIRFDTSRVLPDYVAGYLNSAAGKRYLFERAKPSNNMSNFNATMFGEIPLHVPPLDVQRDFAEAIIGVSGERTRFEAGVTASEALFDSLLHRAFTVGL